MISPLQQHLLSSFHFINLCAVNNNLSFSTQPIYEITHFERLYKDHWSKMNPETPLFCQTLNYITQNLRLQNDTINLDDYPYLNPMELIDKYRGYFSNDILKQLQQVKSTYLQLQRTKDSALIVKLFKDLHFNANWYEYLIKVSKWVLDNFPEPFSTSIFDLLRDGNTFDEWRSSLNQCKFKISKSDTLKEISFPAYPAPVPVLRILQNACYGARKREIVNASIQSQRQLQAQLYGMHLLSIVFVKC